MAESRTPGVGVNVTSPSTLRSPVTPDSKRDCVLGIDYRESAQLVVIFLQFYSNTPREELIVLKSGRTTTVKSPAAWPDGVCGNSKDEDEVDDE